MKLLLKLIKQFFCIHHWRIEVFRDYQERYTISDCMNCDKKIYEDI